MAKTTFSNDDREAAKKDRRVLVAIAVDGSHAPGCPHRDYQHSSLLTPELARELLRAYEDIVVRAMGNT